MANPSIATSRADLARLRETQRLSVTQTEAYLAKNPTVGAQLLTLFDPLNLDTSTVVMNVRWIIDAKIKTEKSLCCNTLSLAHVFKTYALSKVSGGRAGDVFRIWDEVLESYEALTDDELAVAEPLHVAFCRLFRLRFGGTLPTASSVTDALLSVKQGPAEFAGDYAQRFLNLAPDLKLVNSGFDQSMIRAFVLGARKGFQKKLTEAFDKAVSQADAPPGHDRALSIFEQVRTQFLVLTDDEAERRRIDRDPLPLSVSAASAVAAFDRGASAGPVLTGSRGDSLSQRGGRRFRQGRPKKDEGVLPLCSVCDNGARHFHRDCPLITELKKQKAAKPSSSSASVVLLHHLEPDDVAEPFELLCLGRDGDTLDAAVGDDLNMYLVEGATAQLDLAACVSAVSAAAPQDINGVVRATALITRQIECFLAELSLGFLEILFDSGASTSLLSLWHLPPACQDAVRRAMRAATQATFTEGFSGGSKTLFTHEVSVTLTLGSNIVSVTLWVAERLSHAVILGLDSIQPLVGRKCLRFNDSMSFALFAGESDPQPAFSCKDTAVAVAASVPDDANERRLCALAKHLPADQQSALQLMDPRVREFASVFGSEPRQLPLDGPLVPIVLKHPCSPAVVQPNIRVSPGVLEIIHQHLDAMRKVGVIVPIASLSSSQRSLVHHVGRCLIVPKPGHNGQPMSLKSTRLVIDLQGTNADTVADTYVLPTVDGVLQKLAQGVFFISIDFVQSFHQCALDEASVPLTAFNTPSGIYCFKRLPMGSRNATAFMQSLQALMFGHLNNPRAKQYLESYVDDTAGSSDDEEGTIQLLLAILAQCRKHNAVLNFAKCSLVPRKSMALLGSVVAHRSIAIDPERVRSLISMPLPASSDQALRFIGMCCFLAVYVPRLQETLSSLRACVAAPGPFRLSQQAELDCRSILDQLINAVPRVVPGPNEELRLWVDASDIGIGGLIMTMHDELIACFSALLSPTQQKYDALRKELVAATRIAKWFAYLLRGRACTLFSDHLNLTREIDISNHELNPRVARAIMFLRDNFPEMSLVHWPGKLNVAADALSRAYICAALVPQGPSSALPALLADQLAVIVAGYALDKKLQAVYEALTGPAANRPTSGYVAELLRLFSVTDD